MNSAVSFFGDVFPLLVTERLLLRQMDDADAEAVFRLRSDDRVNRYINRPKATSMEEAKKFIAMINGFIREKKSLYWAVTLKGNPALIGTVCLWNFSEDRKRAEIGYELIPDYHRQGIMDEAVTAVIEYAARALHLESLEAFSHRENAGSTKLLLKHQFRRDDSRTDEDDVDNVIYRLELINSP